MRNGDFAEIPRTEGMSFNDTKAQYGTTELNLTTSELEMLIKYVDKEGAKQKALESAENFLRKGIPIETISECIGLPLDQVKQIAESISIKA
ncbi:MAG: hypothetical protein II114_02465 [Treponema sp.]|nr:hypothetical protein [Treponema sp.]